jgi:hypothetical protein
LAHWDGDGGIRHEYVLLDRDIKLHQVTFLKRSAARHTMNRFIVEANAVRCRKLVNQGWRGLRSMTPHHIGSHFIQFRRGHTRTNFTPHGFQYHAHHSAGCAHTLQFFGFVD